MTMNFKLLVLEILSEKLNWLIIGGKKCQIFLMN